MKQVKMFISFSSFLSCGVFIFVQYFFDLVRDQISNKKYLEDKNFLKSMSHKHAFKDIINLSHLFIFTNVIRCSGLPL